MREERRVYITYIRLMSRVLQVKVRASLVVMNRKGKVKVNILLAPGLGTLSEMWVVGWGREE